MIAAQAGTTLLAPTWLALAGLAVVSGIQLQVRRVEGPTFLPRTAARTPHMSVEQYDSYPDSECVLCRMVLC